MLEQSLKYHVGDQIVHCIYGLGTITQIEEKELSGTTGKYYVVETHNLTVWVPVNEEGEQSLRFPTSSGDFQFVFDILSSPGEPLADDRFARRTQLTERLKCGSLEQICRLVRDLSFYKRTKKVNEYDTASLDRAKNLLLREWSFSFSIPISQAEQDLNQMLRECCTT